MMTAAVLFTPHPGERPPLAFPSADLPFATVQRPSAASQ